MYSYVLKAYNDTIIDSYFEFNKDYRLWLHINNDPKKHSSFLTYRNDSIYVDTANFKKQSNSLVAPTKFIYYSNLNETYKKDLMTDSTIYYSIRFPYNSNRGSLTLVSYPKSNESDSSYIYPFIIPEKLDLISERSEHLKTLLE